MMARRWFSRKYYNSPMPHAIFFYHGFAIHGTYDLARLGGPASHGCVRLHPSNAAALFALVERRGRHNTRIVISN
jgi:lipoprotein-anchoring transpeptidase ErfK/SrfK